MQLKFSTKHTQILILSWGISTSIFFSLDLLKKLYRIKTVDFSRIQTHIFTVDGEHKCQLLQPLNYLFNPTLKPATLLLTLLLRNQRGECLGISWWANKQRTSVKFLIIYPANAIEKPDAELTKREKEREREKEKISKSLQHFSETRR